MLETRPGSSARTAERSLQPMENFLIMVHVYNLSTEEAQAAKVAAGIVTKETDSRGLKHFNHRRINNSIKSLTAQPVAAVL